MVHVSQRSYLPNQKNNIMSRQRKVNSNNIILIKITKELGYFRRWRVLQLG